MSQNNSSINNIKVDFYRVTCKVETCANWTCKAYDGICLHHITHTDDKSKQPQEFTRRMEIKGNFGFRMHDGATFAAVFHGGVFACDGPGQMKYPEKQAKRAEQFELCYVPIKKGDDDMLSWAPNSKRYLFAVMNTFEDRYRRLGSFYDSPLLVKTCVFDDEWKPKLVECIWPGSMDLYVIDPLIHEEMQFLASMMQDLPNEKYMNAEQCKWWSVPFAKALAKINRHGIDSSESDVEDPAPAVQRIS